MEEAFSIYWVEKITREAQTGKLRDLLLKAKDEFLNTCSYEELEQEALDYLD